MSCSFKQTNCRVYVVSLKQTNNMPKDYIVLFKTNKQTNGNDNDIGFFKINKQQDP